MSRCKVLNDFFHVGIILINGDVNKSNKRKYGTYSRVCVPNFQIRALSKYNY